jgi:hypothetical protein
LSARTCTGSWQPGIGAFVDIVAGDGWASELAAGSAII